MCRVLARDRRNARSLPCPNLWRALRPNDRCSRRELEAPGRFRNERQNVSCRQVGVPVISLYAWSGPAPAASGPAPAVSGPAPDPGLVTRTTGAGSAAQATGASQPLNAVGYGPTALSGSMPSSGASVPPYPPDDSRQAPSAGPDRPRRRLQRPMLLALLIGALLVVSGATAFALTSFSGNHPPRSKTRRPRRRSH